VISTIVRAARTVRERDHLRPALGALPVEYPVRTAEIEQTEPAHARARARANAVQAAAQPKSKRPVAYRVLLGKKTRRCARQSSAAPVTATACMTRHREQEYHRGPVPGETADVKVRADTAVSGRASAYAFSRREHSGECEECDRVTTNARAKIVVWLTADNMRRCRANRSMARPAPPRTDSGASGQSFRWRGCFDIERDRPVICKVPKPRDDRRAGRSASERHRRASVVPGFSESGSRINFARFDGLAS